MAATFIIADDHPISLKGMESVLKAMGFCILGSYANGLQALNQIILEEPDFVLLDVKMPGLSGIDIAEQIKNKCLKSKIIIYTMFTEASLFEQAKQLNIDGYLLKEFVLEDLEKCIIEIKKGNTWYHPKLEKKLKENMVSFSADLYCKLTKKERIILLGIANNKSNKQLAKEQFLSERTIESHRRNIIKKLDLPNKKNMLLIWAIENKGFFSLID